MLLLAGAGCGLDTARLGDSRAPVADRQGSLAADPASLRYAPTEKELESVRAAAAAAFPKASVSVSRARGTVATLLGASWSAGPCPSSRSAHAMVLDALGAQPDVFRLDPSEWSALGVVSCGQLEPGGTWLTVARQRAGAEPVADQALHVRARRSAPGGALVIDAVVGAWLPVLPALEQAMHLARGGVASEGTLRRAVEKTAFAYTTFDRCVMTGSGVYEAKAPDVVSFDKPRWRQREDAAGVTAWLEQPGRLEVAPEHVTSALIASDAWCPPTAGFTLSFDALAGTLDAWHPGLGCVVCLAP